jgi:hypothetical protein
MPSSADSRRGPLDGVLSRLHQHLRRGTRSDRPAPPLSAWAVVTHAHSLEEAAVPVLNELTAIQADAIRATATAHDRDPDELASELIHLLAADETPGAIEAIDATPAVPALTTARDDTVRILLPLKALR